MRRVEVEPRWLQFRVSEVSLRTDVEVVSEKRTPANSKFVFTQDRAYVAPTLGLIADGTVYHPNFMEYHMDIEGGAAVHNETIKSGNTEINETPGNRTDAVQRYHFLARFLKEKPYATTFHADKDISFQDYDFFSRVEVDDSRYGLLTGYRDGPVPFTLTAVHHEQQATGLDRAFSQEDNTVTLRGQNQRSPYSNTEAGYAFNQFTRQDEGFAADEGINHMIDVRDTEVFGANEKIRLISSLYYTDMGTEDTTITSASLQERVDVKHTEHLESYYNYAYDQHTSESVTDDTHQASAFLRHQLYESLVSTFDVHGIMQSSSGQGSSLENSQYGAGINESYTKRISTWGRLSLGYGGRVDQVDRSTTGPTLSIIGESHTLTGFTLTPLNQPRVKVPTIRVLNVARTITYLLGVDYQVFSHGQTTEISRVPGSIILDPQAVVVDYEVENQPAASYQTYYNQFQFRLDLFEDLVGLYARYGRTMNSNVDTNAVIAPEITDIVVGVDAHWKWFRAGAEYEDYQSNLSPFTTARMFQSATFEPFERSSLSFNLSEGRTTYSDAGRQMTSYQAIGSYRQFFGRYLSCSVEGGMNVQRGEGYDRDLTLARAAVDFFMGKLTLQLGYQFTDETFLGDMREKQFFYFRGKRTF